MVVSAEAFIVVADVNIVWVWAAKKAYSVQAELA